MILYAGVPAPQPTQLYARPACPRCGEILFAATATLFLGNGRLQNTWSCESCEHEFRSLVELPPQLS